MSKLILEADHIVKRYGDQTVLDVERLAVYAEDRIGLIGENGAGKSTLLAILSGELLPDEGHVRRRCPVAVIRQTGDAAHDLAARARALFKAPPAREGLSGGEQTRRRIAGALSEDAPLLLADEPTTDLDGPGIDQLRRALQAQPGALILISHDRALLTALCGRIWHLEDGRITDFPGGYADYQAELTRRRERQQFKYDQYRAEKARLKASAQRMAEWSASVRKAPSRMGNSEARLHTREYTNSVLHLSHARQKLQDRIERLEVKERPRDLPDIRMALGQDRPVRARTALTAQIRRLSAGGRTLLADTELTLPTGSRTALMGVNGCGKSSLLRAIRGELPAGVDFEGSVRLNPGVRLGCFDQDHARSLRLDRTVLENALEDSRKDPSTARTVLARLNLRGDAVFKPVGALSGGERAKAALAKLMLSDINLLILDEPTNHLDLFTLQALEALLRDYGGTALFVSHDRAFVQGAATRIAAFEGGRLATFEGGLSEMEARRNADADPERRRLEISAVEMRMAVLAGRMAAPKKGDDPLKLNAEYDALARRLRELKRP